MAADDELLGQATRLGAALDSRIPIIQTLDSYADGYFPLPPVVERDVKKAYRELMRLTASNWPKLIVDSVEERLEVQGIRFGDEAADEDAWEIWQQNGLDAESSILHQSTLTDGRAYAIVWGDGHPTDPQPVVTLEHASLCAVEYEPGNRRRRRAAIRRWKDNGRWYMNLYRPDFVYKFQSVEKSDELPLEAAKWERREIDNEDWPLRNPFGEVPVVEFAVNRSLRPSPFGTAAGEFEANLAHIDRIHYKIFSGLVALTWSGFPLRYVIGDPMTFEKKRDAQGNRTDEDDLDRPKAPFDALASSIAQLENPEAKIGQLPEATMANYSPEMDIKHLAAVTKTPASYLLPGMINLSDDAIRGMERALVAKVRRHHRSLGESWEDVTRLALRVRNPDDPRGHDQQAQVIWTEPETRSIAERADAATKLHSIGMPLQVIMSKVLAMTPQEISRADTAMAGETLQRLLATNGTPGEPVMQGA